MLDSLQSFGRLSFVTEDTKAAVAKQVRVAVPLKDVLSDSGGEDLLERLVSEAGMGAEAAEELLQSDVNLNRVGEKL